jgi:phosphatidylinositol alpha-mannosyltransferase
VLRAALLCPYSLSVPGGVQGQVLGLADRLHSLGHQATVLAPVDDRRGRVASTLRPVGMPNIVSLGRSLPVKANGSVAPVALGPTASYRALAALRSGRFDVLHIHEPFAPGASYACLMLSKQALVGTFHRSGESILYRLLGPVARPLAGRLQIRCAVSGEALATAERALGGTYELIANGVDVERFATAEPWPTVGPTVMFVGRHEARKGLSVLLEAFSNVNNPDAVCWVAGSGPDTDELQKRYPPSESLHWLGRIDDAELASRLRGSQVACFPSTGGESFGVVLLEAMAARCAIVASDLPAYRAVADGLADLAEPGDPVALARKLEVALSDAASGVGLSSEAALDRASARVESWSLDVMAGRYVSVYEKALAVKGP